MPEVDDEGEGEMSLTRFNDDAVEYNQLQLDSVRNNFALPHVRKTAYVATSDGTATVIAAVPVPADSVIYCKALVVAIKTDGSEVSRTDLTHLFFRDGSANVAAAGSATEVEVETITGTASAVTMVANTTNQTIDIKVAGEAATALKWVAVYEYFGCKAA